MNTRTALLLPLAILATASVGSAAGPVSAPATPKHPVTNTYHGVSVVDPYQWLENWDDPIVKAWSDAQNAAARQTLDSLPNVEAIRARVTEVMSAPTTAHYDLVSAGGRLFAMKRQPPKQQPFLVVMDAPEVPETTRVLLDPGVINAAGTTAIDWYVPSPDGKLVAVSLSEGGSEAGDLHIYDVATGQQVFEVIPHVQNGTGGGALAWEPDSKAFFYTRYPREDERPAEDREFYMQLYRHVLGTPVSTDAYEIGRDFPKIAEVVVETSPEGVALVNMQKGDGGEFQQYLRSLDGRWHQLSRYEDRVVQAVLGTSSDGATTPVYLVSLLEAPRGKLLRLSVDSRNGKGADLAKAALFLPEQTDSLSHEFGLRTGNLLATASHVYVDYQLGGPSEIRVFDLKGQPQTGPKQYDIGTAGGLVAIDPHAEDILFYATSYIDMPAWFRFDPAANTTTRLALIDPAPVDFSDCEVVREWATSKDGTRVPVNIIRRKGTRLDGSNPCVVTGYGGYGVNRQPGFNTRRRVLLDQGVIWAEANIRGGGEFGDAWHRQGNLTLKQNVFDDFAAACRHMVEAGYTSNKRLGIEGGSNGGLLMAATFTQHPELVTCVVSHVGIYDMLRVELAPNGEFNVPEFGTVKDPDQFAALHAYSPYHHVVDGTPYPPVLFLTGANDPRVDPMHSRKMTARLQEAGAGVLLRTSANSGHGIGTALSARIEETVDVFAFLFNHLGVDYRPVAARK